MKSLQYSLHALLPSLRSSLGHLAVGLALSVAVPPGTTSGADALGHGLAADGPTVRITSEAARQDIAFVDFAIESGVAGQVGAVYRFTGVTSGVDALVEILAVSNGALLQIDDADGSSDDLAPQLVGVPADNPQADFKVSFVVQGSTTPIALSDTEINAVDIDGIGTIGGLAEYVRLGSFTDYTLDDPSLVTANPGPTYYEFVGPQIGFAGVGPDNPEVAVRTRMPAVNSFDFSIGMRGAFPSQVTRLFSINMEDGVVDFDDPVVTVVEPAVNVGSVLGAPTPLVDGSFAVPATVSMRNPGEVALYDVQLAYDLSPFGSYVPGLPTYPGQYSIAAINLVDGAGGGIDLSSINPGYDGTSDTNLLSLVPGNVLPVGETITVTLVLRVYGYGNWTYTVDAFGSGDIGQDGVSSGDATLGSQAAVALSPGAATPFVCDLTPYVSLSDGGLTQLYGIDRSTGNYAFNPVGPVAPFTYNALAFNPLDNFQYAVVSTSGGGFVADHVVRIGADGIPQTLGVIPVAGGFTATGGTFLPDGSFVVSGGSDRIFVLDLSGSSVGVVADNTISGVSFTDLAVNPVDPTPNRIYFVDQTGASDRVTYATVDGVIEGVLPLPTGTNINSGSQFFDSFGRLHFRSSTDNTIYRVDMTTGVAEPLSIGISGATHDGSSCAFDVGMQKVAAPTGVPAGGIVTYSYVVSNPRAEAVSGISFSDVMDDGRTYVPLSLSNPFGGLVLPYGGTSALGITGLTLPPNTIDTIQVDVQVPLAVTASTLLNQASLSGLPASLGTNLLSDHGPTAAVPDATPVQISTPLIGAAKRLTGTASLGGGRFSAGFLIKVENPGSEVLHDLQIEDDLSSAFGTAVATAAGVTLPGTYFASASVVTNSFDPLALNGSFDGDADPTLLDITSGGSLAQGDSVTVAVDVTFFPDPQALPLFNSAAASADLLNDNDVDTSDGVSDKSADGPSIDPNANGDPGDDSDPTPVPITLVDDLVVQKRVGSLSDIGGGRYQSEFFISLQNSGSTVIHDVQILDNLTDAFGRVVATPDASTSPGTYHVTQPILAHNAVNALAVNNAYDGAADTALLDISQGGFLLPADSVVVSMQVTFFPDPANLPLTNLAAGSADGVDDDDADDSDGVTDSSTVALDVTVEPGIGAAKTATNIGQIGGGRFAATMQLKVVNTGTAVLHDVQIRDQLTGSFGIAVATPQQVTTPGSYSAGSPSIVVNSADPFAANSGFDGDGDADLLALSSGGSLLPGDSLVVSFVLTFFPDPSALPLLNSGLASGDLIDDDDENLNDGVIDVSTNGEDVDPDGNGDPSDNDDPTPIPVTLQTQLGSAKRITSIASQGDGTYLASFAISAQNTGTITLYDIQIVDNLTATLGSVVSGEDQVNVPGTYYVVSTGIISNATVPFVPNANYNGADDIKLLSIPDGGTLSPGESVVVALTVRFFPDPARVPLSNSAIASGDEVDNNDGDPGDGVLDRSTDGSIPDANGNGDPSDDMTPTPIPVSFVSIGLAKRVSAITQSGDNTYDVAFELRVANLSDELAAPNIQVIDNLAATFPGLSGFELVGTPDLGDLTPASPAFNGTSVTNLLSGTDALPPGETRLISFTVRVRLATSGTFRNAARMQTRSMAGVLLDDDVSDSGDDPDPNGNGESDEADENDPTTFRLPSVTVGIAKSAGTAEQIGPTSFRVPFTLVVENFGATEAPNIQVTDDLLAAFPGATATDISISDGPVSTLLAVSSSFDGTQDIELLVGRQSLQPTQRDTIRFVVDVDVSNVEEGTLTNSAFVATFESAGEGQLYRDRSTVGLDPDPDGDGNPDEDLADGDDADENVPTPIVLSRQVVGIAKEVTDVTSLGAGVYDVSFRLYLENLSQDATVTGVQVSDDLESALGAASSWSLTAGPTSDELSISPAYDGANIVDMLTGTDTLAVGAVATIDFAVSINVGTATGPFANQAFASLTSSDGATVYVDASDAGSDPDADGDGDPGGIGQGDESDPTPIPISAADIISLRKEADRRVAGVGDFVAYTVEIVNEGPVAVDGISITDYLPRGFVLESESVVLLQPGADGLPYTDDDEVRQLTVEGAYPFQTAPFRLPGSGSALLSYVARVGAIASSGVYENRAVPLRGDATVGNEAVATVEVVPDATFDAATVVGKVYVDVNDNGLQDSDEPGIPGARIMLPEGLVIETDQHGRYHVAAVEGGRWENGRNYIARLDPASLPAGAVLTTDNPRLTRVTPGIIRQVDFGVALAAQEQPAGEQVEEFINVDSDLFFAFDSDTVATTAQEELQTLADQIRFDLSRVDSARSLNGGLRYANATTSVALAIVGHSEASGLNIPATRDYVVRPGFAAGDVTLSDEALSTLDSLAADWVGAEDVQIVTVGHVSDLPSADPYRLSELRAEAVTQYVARLIGVDENSIYVVGRGSDVPLVANEDAASRATNERIELSISGRLVTPPDAQIEGGADAYNRDLSDRRARAVYDALTALVPDLEERALVVQVLGRGGESPRASGETAEGRRQNRRVSVTGSIRKTYERRVVPRAEVRVTVDPGTVEPALAVAGPEALGVAPGQVLPARFVAYANYPAFIDRYELLFYRERDTDLSRPIATVEVSSPEILEEIDWAGVRIEGIEREQRLVIVLRAFDRDGRVDETHPTPVELRSGVRGESVASPAAAFGVDNRRVSGIRLEGGRVRLTGSLADTRDALLIAGSTVPTSKDGSFVVETIEPYGLDSVRVEVQSRDGGTWATSESFDVPRNYFVMVGLADVTVGANQAVQVEPLSKDDRFEGDVFSDGRVAFYARGKIRGRYLITASLDTDVDRIRGESAERRALFRNLDPDRYYPVYGDGSTTVEDTPSQSGLYVRIDWDQSTALLGNFVTNFVGTEFARYDRSLYGAVVDYKSNQQTRHGDRRLQAFGFVAEVSTASAHEEFAGTGGSIYYLRETRIVEGSAQLTVEVRDRDTGRVVSRQRLHRGSDFELDEIQGRIILARPLATFAGQVAPSIISDNALDGSPTVLLVDYEYTPIGVSTDRATAGVRGSAWIGDALRVGGTLVAEERDVQDYELLGTDATIRLGKGSYIKAEYATTAANQSIRSLISDDGGLTFEAHTFDSTSTGDAYGVEARVSTADFSDTDATAAAWWRTMEAGYSTSRLRGIHDLTEYGFEGVVRGGDRLQVAARVASIERDGIGRDDRYTAQIAYDPGRIDLTGEVRSTAFTDTADVVTSAVLVAGKVGIDLSRRTNVFAKVQASASESATYDPNNRIGVGLVSKLLPAVDVRLEGSTGDRGFGVLGGADVQVHRKVVVGAAATRGGLGNSARVGSTWQMSDRRRVYGTYTLSTDRIHAERGTLTLGQQVAVSNQLEVFSEAQYVRGRGQSGLAQVYGLDYELGPVVNIGASIQLADQDGSGGVENRRDALSGWVAMRGSRTSLSTKLELRKDRGAIERTQWLASGRGDVGVNDDWSLLGKVNLSRTQRGGAVDEAHFTEAGIGLAYRPVRNTRVNGLAKLIYLHDLPSVVQSPAGFEERSAVAAIDVSVAVGRRFTMAAKVAAKRGGIRGLRVFPNTASVGGSTTSQSVQAEWREATTTLAVAQIRYWLVNSLEAVAEYRVLSVSTVGEQRSGALVGVFKRLGRRFQIGGGYNFSGFSDDLTDRAEERTNSHGWFVNGVAAF